MGRYATHVLAFAQLLIPDEDGDINKYGVQPFIVQIRDLETHKFMPGCKCGDMGPKLGYGSKDNGWLTMSHVRIPRDQMMQKFMVVERDGSVEMRSDLRIMYSTMLLIRCSLI